jgi:hypothetical protein
MMGKKLRNLALLGGLGAAAMMMGRKKDDSISESKEDKERDARERFVSGPLRATESKEDRERDAREKAVSGAVKPRKVDDKKKADAKPAVKTKVDAPTRTVTKKEEGETASGLPREARGGGPDAEKYRDKMAKLEKDQALKTVNPEQYLGPGRLLGGLNTMAKGLAAKLAKKGSDTAKTSTSRDIVPAGAGPTARFLGRGPRQEMPPQLGNVVGAKKGGMIKSSASKRGDGIAMKGKTRGRMV